MSYHTALLQLYSTKGLGDKKLGELIQKLKSEGRTPEDFIAAPLEEQVTQYNLKPEIAAEIPGSVAQSEELYEKLINADVSMIVRGENGYPASLEDSMPGSAPPILFAWGNSDLLKSESVAFSGARDASPTGVELAMSAAKIFASEEINVVSGYARGIDLAAHTSVLTNGGTTTIVLPEGILKFTVKSEIRELIDEYNTLVISRFSPDLPWLAQNAMMRNGVICGMSGALIVVESGATGGTLATGELALKLKKPLFVFDYPADVESSAGNSILISKGGTPIQLSGSDPLAIDPVIDAIRNPVPFTPAPPIQTDLFS